MSYTNEDIFRAVEDCDFERVREMAEAGADFSRIPDREIIRSRRGYVDEIDPSERTETNHFRQGFNSETLLTARTEVVFTESLLDCAAKTGSAELVKYLLDHAAMPQAAARFILRPQQQIRK